MRTKTTIFGAGAVGGHLAARLAAAGAEVSAVCRGAQLAAIKEHGITLQIADQRYHARLNATDQPETLGEQDIVIVTVKSSVLPEMAPLIATLCGPDTAVVFAMNGIPWWYLYRVEKRRLCLIYRASTPRARSPSRSATSGLSVV